jgi:hypothetical protein
LFESELNSCLKLRKGLVLSIQCSF